nr:MAG TPA: hypothetical protein [Caudoviricetes sp.]
MRVGLYQSLERGWKSPLDRRRNLTFLHVDYFFIFSDTL